MDPYDMTLTDCLDRAVKLSKCNDDISKQKIKYILECLRETCHNVEECYNENVPK